MIDDYVLIVDDEEMSLSASVDIIGQFVNENKILTATCAVEALRHVDNKLVKLAFLDIDMPDTNGFSIADYLKNTQPQIKVVFLTGYTDFAAESYNHDAFDFLTKPIDTMRLKKTIEKFEGKNADHSPERIAVETGAGFILLNPLSIFYIAKDNRHTVIKMLDGTSYAVYHTLDNLAMILTEYNFFRTHQSYLVPLGQIVSVAPSVFGKTYEALLSDGTRVPISRNNYPKLKEYLIKKGIKFI